jgi:hypothetical protein
VSGAAAERRAWANASSAERAAYIHGVSERIVYPAVVAVMRAGGSERAVHRAAERALAKAPRFGASR